MAVINLNGAVVVGLKTKKVGKAGSDLTELELADQDGKYILQVWGGAVDLSGLKVTYRYDIQAQVAGRLGGTYGNQQGLSLVKIAAKVV